MEHNFVIALILTTIAGLATLLGGAATFLIKKNNLTALSIGMAFSAGVMIFISLTELLHESEVYIAANIPEHSQMIAFGAFFIGIGIAYVVDFFMPAHLDDEFCSSSETECPQPIAPNKQEIKRAGLLTAFTLSMHRIPEGLAMFFVASTNLALGIPMAIAISIHNFPEGIAVALPVYQATGKKRIAILYSFITTLAGPLGAVIGFFFLKTLLDETLVGALFGIVAGIMIYISLDTLLPLARKYGKNHHVVIGIISGMFFIAMSLLLLH